MEDARLPGSMGLFGKGKPDLEVRVTGMTCGHCEMRVVDAAKGLDGVKDAKASHEGDSLQIWVKGEVDQDALKAVVTEAGYAIA